ncbi:MAG: hypothetical protein VXZ72_03750, partial [Chlamydiota bacterium]|nr:hypothetical protein [Chlamydiota bacterium]
MTKKNFSDGLILPPYISTDWSHVASLFTRENQGGKVLVVTLKSGTEMEVPSLSHEELMEVFEAHQAAVARSRTSDQNTNPFASLMENKEEMLKEMEQKVEGFLRHDPEKKDHPNFPSEMFN